MKKISLTIFCLLLGYIPSVWSQSFTYMGNAPYGIQLSEDPDSSNLAIHYLFRDVDNDEDLDLLLVGFNWKDELSNPINPSDVEYFLDFQENIGTKYSPEFGPRVTYNENFQFPLGYGFFVVDAADLNADENIDFLVSSGVDEDLIQFPFMDFQNNEQGFDRTLLSDFNLDPFIPYSLFYPNLLDLDLDGDLDILMSGYYDSTTEEEGNEPIFLYAKNTGTSMQPEYLGWFSEPYGLQADTFPIMLSSGDLDLDGDIDLLGIGLNDQEKIIPYYENKSGEDMRPVFEGYENSPFGLPVQGENENFFFPSLVDIDGDGDLDFFLPVDRISHFDLDFYRNNDCISNVQEITISICEGESYFLADQEFTQSGEYNIETLDEEGCIDAIHLTLTVMESITTPIEGEICEGEVYFLADQEFTQSGTYELSLLSESGCDSIVQLDLMVNPTFEFTLIETICEGESFEWEGSLYDQSGVYSRELSSKFGCDSILILNLDVKMVTTNNLEVTLCEGESATVGEQEFSMSGEYQIDLMDQYGCDSLIFLDLTVYPDYIEELDASICQGEEFVIAEQSFSQEGTYQIDLFTVFDCDSTILLNLSVHENYSVNLDSTLCLGDSLFIGNELFYESGSYEIHLNTVDNCDSTVLANIVFTHPEMEVTQDGSVLSAHQSEEYIYQWFDCITGKDIDGATQYQLDVPYSGEFAVRITDNFGCEALSECFEVVASKVEELSSTNIKIVPNPAKNYISVALDSGQKIEKYVLYDLKGTVLKKDEFGPEQKIFLLDLSDGVYIIEVHQNGKILRKKIVVIK